LQAKQITKSQTQSSSIIQVNFMREQAATSLQPFTMSAENDRVVNMIASDGIWLSEKLQVCKSKSHLQEL
jgi:hypothetical protein